MVTRKLDTTRLKTDSVFVANKSRRTKNRQWTPINPKEGRMGGKKPRTESPREPQKHSIHNAKCSHGDRAPKDTRQCGSVARSEWIMAHCSFKLLDQVILLPQPPELSSWDHSNGVLLCCSGWFQTPGLKQCSLLGLSKSWDYRGMVAHACNPSTLGGQGRWITMSRDQDRSGQHDENPSLLKIQKLLGMVVRAWKELYDSRGHCGKEGIRATGCFLMQTR
ncbi:Zinc finger protein 714 [Plecturocebus cupreus]